jgi:flagellin-like protein
METTFVFPYNKSAVLRLSEWFLMHLAARIYRSPFVNGVSPSGAEDKNMNNEMKNEEAVSPVIATILMVAITVVLAGVLYVWASSLAGDSTGDTMDTYVWSATDGSGDAKKTGTAAGDQDVLIRVQMDGGQELNWGVVEISITVNGETPMSCGLVEGKCTYDKYEGSGSTDYWSTGEGIVISEGTDDICGDAGACFVAVNIIKKGAGNTDDKTIGTTSSSA